MGSYRKIIGSLDSFAIQTKNFYFYPMYINGKYEERQSDGILETFYVTTPHINNLREYNFRLIVDVVRPRHDKPRARQHAG